MRVRCVLKHLGHEEDVILLGDFGRRGEVVSIHVSAEHCDALLADIEPIQAVSLLGQEDMQIRLWVEDRDVATPHVKHGPAAALLGEPRAAIWNVRHQDLVIHQTVRLQYFPEQHGNSIPKPLAACLHLRPGRERTGLGEGMVDIDPRYLGRLGYPSIAVGRQPWEGRRTHTMQALTRIRDRNVWRIYFATLLVGLAYGISISLIAIHLNARGFGKESIGSLAAWFAAGLVALSIPMGALLRKVPAKRVLTVALIGYAATVTLFPWLGSYSSLAAVRLLDGAFSVAVWVSCETLLLKRADVEHKAHTMSLYAVALALGYVVGPLLARLIAAAAPLSVAFSAAGALAVAAALYVAVRVERDSPVTEAPGQADATVTSSWALLYKIKNSCFATFAYGYFQAAVVLFLPLYLMEEKGITRDQTIVIPAFFAGGMLLFSNFMGRAGDRFGHLLLMRWLSVVGTIMILGFVFLDSYSAMCGAVFIAGASLATISPVSLALQGVQVGPADYSRANGLYNTFYAGGILLGPPVSSQLFARFGGHAMLYHLAALWMGFIVFSIVFAKDDPRYGRALGASSHQLP